MIIVHKRPSRFLALFYVLLVVLGSFSLIHGWFPQLYRLVFLCFGIVMVSVVLVPRFFLSGTFVFIFLYACVVYINYRWGDIYTEGKEYLDGLVLASCASMAYYFAKTDDQKNKCRLFFVSFVIILVDMIGTLTMYLVNPEIVRFAQGLANGGDNVSTLEYYKFGLVEYDVLHGFPVLISPLVMWIRHRETRKKWRFIAWSGLVIIFVLLYISDATMPFLLAILALLLSFLVVKNNHRKSVRRFFIAGMIALPFLLFSSSLKMGVLNIAYSITGGELQNKIDDFRQMSKSGEMEGDVDIRFQLYTISFQQFLRNPIIGTDNVDTRVGHSSVIDRLGAFGLLGIIPWVLVFVFITRFNYKYLPYKARDFYLIGVFCFAFMLLLKNMSYFYTWYSFAVLMPCMCSLNVCDKRSRNV